MVSSRGYFKSYIIFLKIFFSNKKNKKKWEKLHFLFKIAMSYVMQIFVIIYGKIHKKVSEIL